MGHYTKLAVLLIRTMGLMILLYSVPVIIWGLFRAAAGATASDGVTSSARALLEWLFYGLAGLLLSVFALPLGRLAGRGLDEQPSAPPAA